jgi:hypothetical protein
MGSGPPSRIKGSAISDLASVCFGLERINEKSGHQEKRSCVLLEG